MPGEAPKAMFELLTVLIAGIVVLGIYWGSVYANDTLHPLVYLMPMVGFIYVYMPARQYQEGGLLEYFSLAEITYVQGFNFLCVLGLTAGCYLGSRNLKREASRIDVFGYVSTPTMRRTLLQIGIGLGIIGVGTYLYQISNVGGFYAAYDSPKGGGWAASGYIREMDLWVIPAIALVYVSRAGRSLAGLHRILVGVFAMPLLLRGLLTARRGPTFLALATLIGGWYLANRKRPSSLTVIAGGTAIGLFLLFLVSYRGEIYLGSPLLQGDLPGATEAVEKSLERTTESRFGNEFMYGTYVVLNARDRAGHYWGTRYLTQLFVRPIPSAFWPNKYEDVGMKEITVNAGQLRTVNREEEHPLIPKGSAPGFAGSTYVEWAWGGPLFLLSLGWLYAFVWRKNLVQGGIWTVTYVTLLATSAFFVAQSFIAVLFRILMMGIPPVVLWYTFRPKLSSAKRKNIRPASAISGSQRNGE